MRTRLSALSAALLGLTALAADESALPVRDVIATRAEVPMRPAETAKAFKRDGAWWRFTGGAGSVAVFKPVATNAWDLSDWNLVRVDVRNDGTGTVWIAGRLDNAGAQDWANCAPSSAVALPGETVTLGFPFNRPDSQYTGSPLFRGQLGKPSGHRSHWRGFNPEDVRALRMHIRSSAPEVRVSFRGLGAAWPADTNLTARLESLPYLDRFGQVRALTWRGKIETEDDLLATRDRNLAAIARRPGPATFDAYGGWSNGPTRKATGAFRTEKVDGRWWLVTPEGHLFWSLGACCVGWSAATPVTKERANFFAWLPPTNDPLHDIGLSAGKSGTKVNFPAMNLARMYASDWEEKARDLTHRQLRACGVNTMAAWSDEGLMRDHRTPYTLTAGIWWPIWKAEGHDHMPEPFDPSFEENVRKSLADLAWAKDDPWCLGVFIDNELDWPDDFGVQVLKAPSWQPTKKWAAGQMREKYGDIAALNAAWKTSYTNWDAIAQRTDVPATSAMRGDFDALYAKYARAYFAACRKALDEALPGRLYLGCRAHRGPAVVGRAAAGLVDVFSVNSYELMPNAQHILPRDVDLPVIASEYHFGAPDRGVPGVGLRCVNDQIQRGRALAGYVAGALADPRFVGCHWFQWIDQNAAGRPGENYQVGYVDVCGTLYPEFAATSARIADRLYPARSAGGSPEKMLDALLRQAPGAQND